MTLVNGGIAKKETTATPRRPALSRGSYDMFDKFRLGLRGQVDDYLAGDEKNRDVRTRKRRDDVRAG